MRNTLLVGHVLDELRRLPDACVDTVVTSPPYWALRSYLAEPVIFGGDPACSHVWSEPLKGGWNRRGNTGGGPESSGLTNPTRQHGLERPSTAGTSCACGAWRGQLGMEPTPELYVEHMVEIFREVFRVLAPHGSCWVNIADTWYGSQSSTSGEMGRKNYTASGQKFNKGARGSIQAQVQPRRHPRLKRKDLCLIPERLAIALQEAGWTVRSKVVWHKPNPMPSSVLDRATQSHEYVLHLTKRATYFYNADAVREPPVSTDSRLNSDAGGLGDWSDKAQAAERGNNMLRLGARRYVPPNGRNMRSVWTLSTEPAEWHMCRGCERIHTLAEYRALAQLEDKTKVCTCGSTEWVVHSATFPKAIPERCILASTCPAGYCTACGTPQKPVRPRGPKRKRAAEWRETDHDAATPPIT
jgi:DNA modification methylase